MCWFCSLWPLCSVQPARVWLSCVWFSRLSLIITCSGEFYFYLTVFSDDSYVPPLSPWVFGGHQAVLALSQKIQICSCGGSWGITGLEQNQPLQPSSCLKGFKAPMWHLLGLWFLHVLTGSRQFSGDSPFPWGLYPDYNFLSFPQGWHEFILFHT